MKKKDKTTIINEFNNTPGYLLYKPNETGKRSNFTNAKTYWPWIANMLVENDSKLDEIKQITRISSYYTGTHGKLDKQKYTNDANSEKKDVHNLYSKLKDNKDFTMIDYETPLYTSKDNSIECDQSNIGEIDFIILNNGFLYIVEYKKEHSEESALRCILEIETYYRVLDKVKLIEDFSEAKGYKIKGIKKAICIYENSYAFNNLFDTKEKEVREEYLKGRDDLMQLLDRYDISIISADEIFDSKIKFLFQPE